MMKSLLLTLSLLISLSATGVAQKFGYCNAEGLLTQLPEVKAADSELQAFQNQLTKRGQERVKALQDAAAELQRKKDQGTIAPKEYDTQAAKLKEEQESIAQYEQEVYQKLGKKREELFKPLLDKVNAAMATVAKANGFTLVFDTSSNVVLYGDESLDVTKLVKAQLGITTN
ncbi:MAG: OmpH family outer membrane protein [Bacteroidota bacterium]